MNQRMAIWKQAFFLLCCLLLAACAGGGASPALLGVGADDSSLVARAEAILASDPAGAVPAPSIPSEVASGAAELPPPRDRDPIPYTVECEAPGAPELAQAFQSGAVLYRLMDVPVHSLTSLEQRLAASLKDGRDMLHSFGYYSGQVTGSILRIRDEEDRAAPETRADGRERGERRRSASGGVLVRVEFAPGPQYLMGESRVLAEAGPLLRPKPADDVLPLPATLEDVELAAEAPAVADDVLAAVDRVLEAYRNRGYPFAELSSTRYTLDHEALRLEAEVRVNPGDFVRMGEIEVNESPSVSKEYFDALRSWRVGRPWSDRRVQSFRERLQQSGLFQSIDIAPGEAPENPDDPELRTVMLNLAGAPERTVGGALKYDSDFGPGLQAFWTHRNVGGHADPLRLEMPLWADMQEFTANYRRPFALRDDQNFIAQGGLLNQTTDAYEIQSAAAAAGFDRRFSRQWRATLQASAEGGYLKDLGAERRRYMMLGLPGSVTYSTANSLLNATRGVRVTVSAAPYTGIYGNDFSVARGRVDAAAYVPVADEDELVIAVRGAYGSLFGAKAGEVPPSVRFYSGGGGSVRGYAFQSLGPRDANNRPLGGSSLVELSTELRWNITDVLGLVAFVDGGAAYDTSSPDVDAKLRWGAGLGMRYHTAIGPVRLDVAMPLDKRGDDDSFQFYISIGQSF